MSPRLPSVTARQVIQALEAICFERIRQSGSHATFHHPDGRWTIVSIHPGKTIPRSTLRKILRDANLTVGQFLELL
jgi:predicted RNA binding protein YcfA (HicA-like mRNA interferase family)